VRPERLRETVRFLAGSGIARSVDHVAGLDRAAAWIGAAMTAAGLDVEDQPYRLEQGLYRNVLGWRVHADPALPLLVVGAHYDAFGPFPAADDNASGVAVLLELARATRDLVVPHPVLFAAFSTEEPTSELGLEARGSHCLARRLARAGRAVGLMVSLEMLGYYDDTPGSQRFPLPGLGLLYPDRGHFLAVVGDLGSIRPVWRVWRAMRRARTLPVRPFCGPASLRGVHWSDHASFRALGFPAVMVTDTAFYRNPHYHTAHDTPDTLDYERMDRAVDALVPIVRRGG
jgi:Zn-dependent M28 family amino/carboxypeptidase